MKHLPALLVAAALVLAPATTAFAADEEGGLGVRLVDASTGASTDPNARAYIIEHIAPGGAIERNIEVQNHSRQKRSVEIYAGAADVTDSQFTPKEDSGREDLSDWTSVPEPTLVLGAGESAMVPVSISIPADAPEGEMYGVVWAQIQDQGAAAVQVSRVGIREYIYVGAGNPPAADYSVGDPTGSRDQDGIPVATAKVTNTGGRALTIAGALSLADGPGGTSAGPFDVTSGVTIEPGASADVSVSLDAATPNGPWKASLVLSGGGVTHEATGELTFPALQAASAPDTAPAARQSTLVWLGAAGLLLAAVSAGAAFGVRRNRGKQNPAAPSEAAGQ